MNQRKRSIWSKLYITEITEIQNGRIIGKESIISKNL
jgi:hypothetical protein